jgi:hypothetical protein
VTVAANDLITLARAREALRPPDRRKPWDYQVTLAVPHRETPETLPVLLELYRLQTVRPYVLIIDAGSPWRVARELEKLRGPGVEVHYVRAHAYRHPSAAVTTALDLAHALCRTPYLLHTHTDVFPRRRDLVEWLLTLCRADQPVVGYEMSPRPGVQGWRNVVSHTCTLLHMPTIRRIGATWSFERYWEATAGRVRQAPGYPDTEQPFDRCLRRAGVFPYLIGHDANRERYADENIDHVRSLTGLRRNFRGTPVHLAAERCLASALREARERIAAWRKEVAHGG